MRSLHAHELARVSGAGDAIFIPPEQLPGGDSGTPTPTPERMKNNNGYGNGAEDGPAPGRSGEHNPQLIKANLGPLGDR